VNRTVNLILSDIANTVCERYWDRDTWSEIIGLLVIACKSIHYAIFCSLISFYVVQHLPFSSRSLRSTFSVKFLTLRARATLHAIPSVYSVIPHITIHLTMVLTTINNTIIILPLPFRRHIILLPMSSPSSLSSLMMASLLAIAEGKTMMAMMIRTRRNTMRGVTKGMLQVRGQRIPILKRWSRREGGTCVVLLHFLALFVWRISLYYDLCWMGDFLCWVLSHYHLYFIYAVLVDKLLFRTNPNVHTKPTIIQRCPSHSTFQSAVLSQQSTASRRIDA